MTKPVFFAIQPAKVRHTNSLLLLAMSLVLGTSALKANLVTNGNFENASLSGWTSSVEWSALPSVTGISGPHSGQFFATTPCIGTVCITIPTSFLFQTLNTTIGQSYTLDFFYNPGIEPVQTNGMYPIDSTILVTWGGTVAYNFSFASPTVSTGWQEVTVSGLVANSTSTVLRFSGRQDHAFLGFDDINVSAATPEPGTLVGVGSFLVGLAVFRFGVGFRRSRTGGVKSEFLR